MTIRLLFLMVDTALECHVGIAAHFFCEPLIHRSSFSLAWGPRRQDRLITQNTLEGSQPRGGVLQ